MGWVLHLLLSRRGNSRVSPRRPFPPTCCAFNPRPIPCGAATIGGRVAAPGAPRTLPRGGGARFPEGGLYVCPDLPPLAPAVRAVQRALMHVAVEGASPAWCDCFCDTVRDVMFQLVGDAPDGRGPAVFGRDKFETAFALEWVEE